jgi:predicted amidophosphoribosyltransferase
MQIKKILEKIKNNISDFFYPSFCLHCKEKIEKNDRFFCNACSELLILVDPIFNMNYFAAFEKMGPGFSLCRALKKENFFKLTKGAAAFMVAQFINLKWPEVDVIVPMTSFLKKDHIYLLAKEISKILEKPVVWKSKEFQRVLFVKDIVNYRVTKETKKFCYKEAFYLGLCFDVPSDHLNLTT